MIRIAVCVKVIGGELNPFDECALEEALRVDDAEVTVVSMCPPSAAERLRTLTRLGVRKVLLLSDPAFAGSDTLATAYVLSVALRQLSPDYVFCGRQTIDGDTAQVGPSLSVQLGCGLITNVMRIKRLSATAAVCETRLGEEEVSAPAVLTIERINTLRFPSIRSRLGEIGILTNRELGADVSRCGLRGSPTRVLKTFENQSGRRKCTFIPVSEVPALISGLSLKPAPEKQLPSEAAGLRLPVVWAVGGTVAEKAEAIAERVEVIPPGSAAEIAAVLRENHASVVLWNADLWGRRTAPQVAAMLNTGLCADCTSLETDGEKLIMYRPARGGNVIAKIECLTEPQMATVRCEQRSDDVLLSCGLGASGSVDRMRELACRLGAELAASRPMVDRNLAPYESQVGLTGRTVAPKLYVAVGISGAVQHVCAISGAQTVVAVNPDKDAPIFDYADYGVVDTAERLLEQYSL